MPAWSQLLLISTTDMGQTRLGTQCYPHVQPSKQHESFCQIRITLDLRLIRLQAKWPVEHIPMVLPRSRHGKQLWVMLLLILQSCSMLGSCFTTLLAASADPYQTVSQQQRGHQFPGASSSLCEQNACKAPLLAQMAH